MLDCRLTDLLNSLTDCFDSLVGRTMRVWLCGEKSADGKFALGHTKSYVQVGFPKYFNDCCVCQVMLSLADAPLAGQVDVLITEAQRWCVLGTIVRVVSVAEPPKSSFSLQGIVPDPEEDERFEQKILKEEEAEKEATACCEGTGSCACKEESAAAVSAPPPAQAVVSASPHSLLQTVTVGAAALAIFFGVALSNLDATLLGLVMAVFLLVNLK